MNNGFDFLIYKAADEEVSVNAVIKDDTIWQQITDIFAECSIDYDKTSDVTKRFYATVQNKFHYAITNLKQPQKSFMTVLIKARSIWA